MSVSIDDVKYIADLARLNFDEQELEGFTSSFNEILSFFEKLNQLNTDNIEPMSHPVPNENVFREDLLKNSIDREEALKNSPDRDHQFFKVPKVINQ
ncbi:MAG TPA: Asp-tRNA(Asn)/Glu-tRNA(Gln) amidotransferase subunit GatC [Melioribacteraceae bacterium]|nr:Asp-tRNA(Asn)/Glu-tRNA(Gln) amidotransferase subunit GatC [Melioribacteraceae bacterium]